VAELMLFRRDADGRDVELPGSTVALEVELQRRVEAGLESMLGIRFLASEYPTGRGTEAGSTPSGWTRMAARW
jgi:hypothetical protein